MGFFSQVILTIFPVFRPIYKSYFNPVSLLLFCFGHFFLLTVSRKIWWRPVERVRLSKSAVNRMTVERYWRTLKPTLPIFSQLKMFWSLAFCASQAALVECAHQILRQGLCWQEWPRGRAQVMLTVAKSGADLENQKITTLNPEGYPVCPRSLSAGKNSRGVQFEMVEVVTDRGSLICFSYFVTSLFVSFSQLCNMWRYNVCTMNIVMFFFHHLSPTMSPTFGIQFGSQGDPMQDKLYEASALHNVAVGKWWLGSSSHVGTHALHMHPPQTSLVVSRWARFSFPSFWRCIPKVQRVPFQGHSDAVRRSDSTRKHVAFYIKSKIQYQIFSDFETFITQGKKNQP